MRVLIPALLMAVCGCSYLHIPAPSPSPSPEACPSDLPWCHEAGMTCGECKHNPSTDPDHCEKAPECPAPTPEPTPEPSPQPFDFAACEAASASGVCLEGQPTMGAYWLQRKIADATPKICSFERCAYYGWTDGRRCCPTVPDGDPRRQASERELMGADYPMWQAEGLIRDDREKWFFVVAGGQDHGRVRACFADGTACSKWLSWNLGLD